MNISIPAFPSQDLAKLVLGYLAEEQLMTAYDEFLQASPYLDAHSNEYDRIFMTSLKNILAEYRAVKICVETCKPISLRKKIFQCANLLEIVKFLIQNTDISKIGVQETTTDKFSTNKHNVSYAQMRTTSCDVCNSLRLTCCGCIKNNVSESSANPSMETTPLSDLPGSHYKQKKQKSSETGSTTSSFCKNTESSVSSQNNDIQANIATGCSQTIKSTTPKQSNLHQESSVPNQYLENNTHTTPESLKLEEFNKILNLVSTRNGPVNKKDFSHNLGLTEVTNRVSGAENFQVFSSGITGGDSGIASNVPDSSTSEHCTMQESSNAKPTLVSQSQSVSQCGNKRVIKRQYLLKVATVDNNTICKVNNEFVNSSHNSLSHHKSDDPKITILSDVKVDNAMPSVLKSSATSTPLMPMETIMINGTPVYRHLPQAPATNYTKDEIMAMPTIILMPASAPPGVTTNTQTTTMSKVNDPRQSVEPLIIDISPDNKSNQLYNHQIVNFDYDDTKHIDSKTLYAQKEVKDSNMTEAAELTAKNATAPKDETGISKTSTPHVLPPKRKSSSTPRRSSHIRVLDFATPRRILHEAINERPSLEEEVILSRSPNLVTSNVVSVGEVTSNTEKISNNNLSLKENIVTLNNPKNKKTGNWDSDLRVIAIQNPLDEANIPIPQPKKKSKNKPKVSNKNELGNKTNKEKKTNKKNKTKNSEIDLIVIDDNPTEIEKDVAQVDKTTPNGDKPIKPTINILPGNDWGSTSVQDSDKSQNKLANNDTPEIDRLSLHNAIDSKLNISELLETPYKQALYDIQMGTPRFFGPDLPGGEPLSDIKIMNIPTPRFLNTPIPAQATPGSYSSRPTDYSSGGSYYKPDDLDYVPNIECLIIPKNDSEKIETQVTRKRKDSGTEKKVSTKSSRPTRKCAKNVSYYNISTSKTKENDDKSSTCSDTLSVNSSFDNSKENKPYKDDRSNRRSSVKAKDCISKTDKSPVKKETPKTTTKNKPLLKNMSARKTKTPESSRRLTTKQPPRKKTNTKEKHVTPTALPAPTRSRRKSSTPRKLHCTKQYNSAISENENPLTGNKIVSDKKIHSLVSDSDPEQTTLRWSDDCSHDSTVRLQTAELNDTDDILKIKEFIETTETTVTKKSDSDEISCTQINLIKRGFDVETAKIIERDLLDLPPDSTDESVPLKPVNIVQENIIITSHERKSDINQISTTTTVVMESEKTNRASDIVVGIKEINDESDDDNDEIELSVNECNEDTNNFVSYNFEDNKDFSEKDLSKLKDKYSMEVCIDEHVSIRLRATPFSVTLDLNTEEVEHYDYSYKETEMAVNSISNIDRLYTPLKDFNRAKCIEIFDSTLTSLDTPVKCSSQKEHESTVTDIVLEVDNVDEQKQDTKKRKRQTDELTNEIKKPKTDSIELSICSADMQKIDIETVLSKLHGP